MFAQPKIGILLANTGTPSAPTPHAVRSYLGQYLLDRRIAPMNPFFWRLIVHLYILPSRSKRSSAKYKKIWTDKGSPFAVAYAKLTRGLQEAFVKEEGKEIVVVCGMSYGEQTLVKACQKLQDSGCRQVFVLPMYPQSSYATTGAVCDGVERAMKRLKWKVPYHVIENYYDNPVYIKAVAASLKHAGFDSDSDDKVLFSFHSIPLKDVEAGDTYELQSSASSLQIASELGLSRKRWTIGYQCRFDKARAWLSPYTTDILSRWAEAGVGRIFLVCPGFSVDCLETLYEIPYELRPHYSRACARSGRPVQERELIYVPCLDKSKAHIKVLQDIMHPYLDDL